MIALCANSLPRLFMPFTWEPAPTSAEKQALLRTAFAQIKSYGYEALELMDFTIPLTEENALLLREASLTCLLPEMAAVTRPLCEYAASLGMKVAVENAGSLVNGADRLIQLIEAVDHPAYGVTLDIGNFLCIDQAAPPGYWHCCLTLIISISKTFLSAPLPICRILHFPSSAPLRGPGCGALSSDWGIWSFYP